mgnify:CR=1 FL=1
MEYNYIVVLSIIIILSIVILLYKYNNNNNKTESKIITTNDNTEIISYDKLNKNIISIKKFIQLFINLYKNQLSNDNNNIIDKLNKSSIFNKDISKVNLLLDSYSSYNHVSQISHESKYIYKFNNTASLPDAKYKNDSTYGGGGNLDTFKNIISMRLVKAIIPSQSYTINNNNNTIKYRINDESVTCTLANGFYNNDTINDAFDASKASYIVDGGTYDDAIHKLTIDVDSNTNKYTITCGSEPSYKLSILWSECKYAYLFFGFNFLDNSYSDNNTVQSTTHPSHNLTYIDLVVDELPSIACKYNINRLNILDRIPIIDGNNRYNVYENPIKETDHYFFPINISQLSISLYDPFGNIIDIQNDDFSIELELHQINNHNKLKLI